MPEHSSHGLDSSALPQRHGASRQRCSTFFCKSVLKLGWSPIRVRALQWRGARHAGGRARVIKVVGAVAATAVQARASTALVGLRGSARGRLRVDRHGQLQGRRAGGERQTGSQSHTTQTDESRHRTNRLPTQNREPLRAESASCNRNQHTLVAPTLAPFALPAEPAAARASRSLCFLARRSATCSATSALLPKSTSLARTTLAPWAAAAAA